MDGMLFSAVSCAAPGGRLRVRIERAGAVLRWSVCGDGLDGCGGPALGIARALMALAGGRTGCAWHPTGGMALYFDVPRSR
jgi:hypothetical protein